MREIRDTREVLQRKHHRSKREEEGEDTQFLRLLSRGKLQDLLFDTSQVSFPSDDGHDKNVKDLQEEVETEGKESSLLYFIRVSFP